MFRTGTVLFVFGTFFVLSTILCTSDGCEATQSQPEKCGHARLDHLGRYLKSASERMSGTGSDSDEVDQTSKASKADEIDVSAIHLLHPVYRQVYENLRMTTLPEMSPDALDLSSYTPFCSVNGTLTPVSAPHLPIGVNRSCMPWEELELDMLLMYIDLIAVGMTRALAEQFYRQIRCLSRANVRVVPETLAWEVCFSFDFSMHVGTLLAHYIQQDAELNPPVKTASPSPATVNRMEVMNTSRLSLTEGSVKQTSFTSLLLLFQFAESFRLYRDSNTFQARYDELVKTSCCKSCASPDYFVNLEDMSCVSDPFGKHCCHTACKSLRHLRIGVTTSIYYCCLNSNPQRCVQGG